MIMKIFIDSKITIKNPLPIIKNFIEEQLEIKNPDYVKKMAMRILDWKYT